MPCREFKGPSAALHRALSNAFQGSRRLAPFVDARMLVCTDTSVQGFVGPLIPGTYQVKAIFESSGVDSNTYLNPLLGNPEELAAFLPGNWKGLLTSKVLTITIVGERGTKKR